ncbi:hypothetical protein MHD_09080 [Mannheimia granulomatis]|uniref:3',5'-cyclic adenosine monophosphate phosphodiesterase CpdA n=1 Tax=Mannheimia granulomatis TaxID=85402 RepID=A0A011LW31_9PAST|nr:3',5'-cyclic-AMP phosphodiesterase [Mannheimia granulomatis]EXI61418.1 3',5'-cyclic-nucleotide phosphodiesterase [Mannheimia granulomatis]RGE47646.1 hypothetical protein MHD_09080 [Mannheimia granulomatis]
MNESLKLDKKGAIRLLQITDPHLLSTPQETLLEVKTVESFAAVINQINAQVAETSQPFDLVLATGDLIQDHHIAGYHHFAKITAKLNTSIVWLEGNHDTQPNMGEILATYPHISPHRHILVGDYWQILMLNTQVIGRPYGELSSEQLVWLEETLNQFPERFSLIAQHHNILPTNSAWLDQHSLKNADKLAEILTKFKKVKGIVHGHIHQQVDSIWKDIPIFATPSTCIQFKPNCDQFTLDTLPQGWREFYLHEDGEIETVVKRLNSNDFLPNLNSKGY